MSSTCTDTRPPLSKPSKVYLSFFKPDCFFRKGYYQAEYDRYVASDQSYGAACVETCNCKPEECSKQCAAECLCDRSDDVRQRNRINSLCSRDGQSGPGT